MSKITVTLPVDEALFVLAALDRHATDAYAAARRMRNRGIPDEQHELLVADTTIQKTEAARKRIADVLYPPIEDTSGLEYIAPPQ